MVIHNLFLITSLLFQTNENEKWGGTIEIIFSYIFFQNLQSLKY